MRAECLIAQNKALLEVAVVTINKLAWSDGSTGVTFNEMREVLEKLGHMQANVRHLSELRHFPEQPERVESGPIQFGDDWPGLFLRGDHAVPYSFYLKQIQYAIEKEDMDALKMFSVIYLPGMIKELQSCDVRNLQPPQEKVREDE